MAITPGTRFGRYEIRSKLGEGGMGEVYLAEDTTLRRLVAIKFLPATLIANEEANKRFLREAQIAARLDHPNICTVYEVALEEEQSFIVMQYIEGETLESRMKKEPLSVSESLRITMAVADALTEAHSRGIIHRDIKPSNIMLTKHERPKVMDFGLARLSHSSTIGADAGLDIEASTQMMVTSPGTIIGTVPYMSPEQVHGQALDERTDIFSFGVMLYQMLTGTQPFAAESPAGIISAILTAEPGRVSDYIPNCPPELELILKKCLAKDREHRYPSMRDVALDLEGVGRDDRNFSPVSGAELRTERLSAAKATAAVPRQNFFDKRRLVFLSTGIVVAAVAVLAYFYLVRVWSGSATQSSASSRAAANDNYLRAKVLLSSENRDDTESGIKLLEQVVAVDPNLAVAWSQLARAYYIKAFYYTPEEARQLNRDAQFANEKALSIDPNLAEAHFVKGLLLWTHANRFPHDQAILSYKRALSLDPNLDEAHHQLGLVYFHIGLLDKGWAEIEKAVAANPSNQLARFRFGVIYLYRGQYEEALSFFKSTPLEKNPSLWAFQSATALFQLGRNNEATALLDKYLHDHPEDEGGVGASVKAMIFAKDKKESDANEQIAQAIRVGQNFGHFHHTAYNIACAYALMNKPAQAIQWLQTASDDGFPCYPLFANDPNLNSLRQNKSFIAFMAKLRQQLERYKTL